VAPSSTTSAAEALTGGAGTSTSGEDIAKEIKAALEGKKGKTVNIFGKEVDKAEFTSFLSGLAGGVYSALASNQEAGPTILAGAAGAFGKLGEQQDFNAVRGDRALTTNIQQQLGLHGLELRHQADTAAAQDAAAAERSKLLLKLAKTHWLEVDGVVSGYADLNPAIAAGDLSNLGVVQRDIPNPIMSSLRREQAIADLGAKLNEGPSGNLANWNRKALVELRGNKAFQAQAENALRILNGQTGEVIDLGGGRKMLEHDRARWRSALISITKKAGDAGSKEVESFLEWFAGEVATGLVGRDVEAETAAGAFKGPVE